MTKTIAFIGAGNMAKAIIAGLLSQGLPPDKIIIASRTPEKTQALQKQWRVRVADNNRAAVEAADVMVLAVKPQQMTEVVLSLAPVFIEKKPLLITVAAGIPIARYLEWIGEPLPFIRAMPNTPASIRKGATALFANILADEHHCAIADMIFESVGKIFWLPQEAQINSAIALIGSGPAYVFLWMEMLQSIAEEMGLPHDMTVEMTKQLMLGSSELAAMSCDSFEALRRQVTSPGGTTERATQTFEAEGLRDITRKAMRAAADRALELEKL